MPHLKTVAGGTIEPGIYRGNIHTHNMCECYHGQDVSHYNDRLLPTKRA